MQQEPKLVDLDEYLLDVGAGWSRTPEVELRGWTTDDGPFADRVEDPTRPGEFVFGPAVVVLEVAPDHGRRLIVRDLDR
jgi:hypothetical protein